MVESRIYTVYMSEVQEAPVAGAVTRTVPGYGQGTVPGPPRGPATPVDGARLRATEVEVEEEVRPAAYMPPGQKGLGFTAPQWTTSTPITSSRTPLPGPSAPVPTRNVAPSQLTGTTPPQRSPGTSPPEDTNMESDSIGEASGGAPLEETRLDLPPSQQALDRLHWDRQHQSGSASMDDGYPPSKRRTRPVSRNVWTRKIKRVRSCSWATSSVTWREGGTFSTAAGELSEKKKTR